MNKKLNYKLGVFQTLPAQTMREEFRSDWPEAADWRSRSIRLQERPSSHGPRANMTEFLRRPHKQAVSRHTAAFWEEHMSNIMKMKESPRNTNFFGFLVETTFGAFDTEQNLGPIGQRP